MVRWFFSGFSGFRPPLMNDRLAICEVFLKGAVLCMCVLLLFCHCDVCYFVFVFCRLRFLSNTLSKTMDLFEFKDGNSYFRNKGLKGLRSENLNRWMYFRHLLTHLCLASHKRDIGKQCRPRSDAAECGVWSGSTLFAITLENFNTFSI